MLIKFIEVASPEGRRGEVLYEIDTVMTLDGYPHVPAHGETILFPGEPEAKRRVVVGIHKKYSKRKPTFSVVVAMMPLKAWNALSSRKQRRRQS